MATMTVGRSLEREANSLESGSAAVKSAAVGEAAAVTKPANRADYGFVTNARFVSMVGVVALHAQIMTLSWHGGHWNMVFDQLMKFGTVCFFLISGFLLGDRIETTSPAQYMLRRLRTTAVPWAVWTSVFLVMNLTIDWLARGSEMRSLGFHLNNSVLNSAYWFVPNILLSLATLLAFRRWLNSLWFGAMLGAASLSYGLNLYFRWSTDTRHNSAWAGFIVFLWLGYQLRRHVGAARAWIARAPWSLLVALGVITYALALGESKVLNDRYGDDFDFLNTLRISNVAYSFVAFAMLFKVARRLEPPGMDARQHTFGIYLLHPIIFGLVSRLFKVIAAKALGVSALAFNDHVTDYIHSAGGRFAVQLGVFAVVYLTSWACVSAMARTRLSRYIGVRE